MDVVLNKITNLGYNRFNTF